MLTNIEELEKTETKFLLNDYRVPFNWMGYKYLVTAMPFIIGKINLNEKLILNELYEYVAKKHKTTSKKVQYAIRYLHENTDIGLKMGIDNVSNQNLMVNLATKIMKKLNI